jgi:hypothetical protein
MVLDFLSGVPIIKTRHKRNRRESDRRYRETHHEQKLDSDRHYRETHREQRRNSDHELDKSVKKEVFTQYYRKLTGDRHSKPRCLGFMSKNPALRKRVCVENDLRCLQIHHENGSGRAHMRNIGVSGGESYYRYLKHHDYPLEDPIGHRLLIICACCNSIEAYESKKRPQT